jgi:hypothetical protein
MMSPAKLVSSRKCLGPNVFCVWGMCFKHGQQVRSALWKWCSLIVVDWHKSTQLFICSSSGHCEIKNHFKTTGFRLPTHLPISQSWKTKSGHALFARMVLYFTAVRQCQNLSSTLTDWGRGWEIRWALFSNGSLFSNDRTPKLNKKHIYCVQKDRAMFTSRWTLKCLRPDGPKIVTSRSTQKWFDVQISPKMFSRPWTPVPWVPQVFLREL